MTVAELPASNRLPAWHEWSIYAAFATLVLTGATWLIIHNFVVVAGPFGPQPSAVEPWLLRVHGAATTVFLVLVGALIPNHIRLAWRARRHRWTGGLTASAMLVLAASGDGLYYIAEENVRPITSLLHWIVGIAACVALGVHALIGRRRL